MSLMHTVAALVEKGIANNTDALLPHCHGATRKQVMVAVCNASQRGLIHRVGRVSQPGKPSQPLGLYAPGPKPKQGKPWAAEAVAPPNSVFQMGERAYAQEVSP